MTKALALAVLTLAGAAHAEGGRFALVIGNNQGAAGRSQLWFAERDAEVLARALTELGEFEAGNIQLLRNASLEHARSTLAALEAQVASAQRAGQRTLLLVYYSGHANPAGLELGTERWSYSELRQKLAGSVADVKVAIVDACDSGGLTQVKGGRPAPALDFALPDEELVRGVALVASTSVGELAQESARLGGSFFTHHLEVGLRGAADADGDARVTLGEAFRYTAGRTVVETAATRVGPQHPTYDLRMSGRGDVVLADLRRAESRISLSPAPGALYVVTGPRRFVAEIPGAATPLQVAVPAGAYRVELRERANRRQAEVVVGSGQTVQLPPLRAAEYDLARSKGGPGQSREVFAGISVLGLPVPGAAAAAGLHAGARLNPWKAPAVLLRLSGTSRRLVDGDLTFHLLAAGGEGAVLWPVLRGWLFVEAGSLVGYTRLVQTLAPGVTLAANDFSAGALVRAGLPVGPLRVWVEASGRAHLLRMNAHWVVRARPEVSLSVGHPF